MDPRDRFAAAAHHHVLRTSGISALKGAAAEVSDEFGDLHGDRNTLRPDGLRPFFHIDSPPENLPASAHCADFIAAGDFIREADFICRWQISLRISLP